MTVMKQALLDAGVIHVWQDKVCKECSSRSNRGLCSVKGYHIRKADQACKDFTYADADAEEAAHDAKELRRQELEASRNEAIYEDIAEAKRKGEW